MAKDAGPGPLGLWVGGILTLIVLLRAPLDPTGWQLAGWLTKWLPVTRGDRRPGLVTRLLTA